MILVMTCVWNNTLCDSTDYPLYCVKTLSHPLIPTKMLLRSSGLAGGDITYRLVHFIPITAKKTGKRYFSQRIGGTTAWV